MASVTILPPDEGDRTAAVVAAEIITAINTTANTTGDVVTLPAGTFDCSATQLATLAAITLRGAGKALTIVKASLVVGFSATLEDFTLDTTGVTAPNITAFVAGFANTFVSSAICYDGTFALNRVRVGVGAATTAGSNTITFAASSGKSCTAVCTDCEFDHAVADVVSTKAHDQTAGDASWVTLNNCSLHHCGSANIDQLATTHNYFGMTLHSCALTDPGTTYRLLTQPAASTDPLYVYNCTGVGGTVYATEIIGGSFTECQLKAYSKIIRNTVIGTNTASSPFIATFHLNGTGEVSGNYGVNTITNDYGIYVEGGGSTIKNNVMLTTAASTNPGIRINTNATGLHQILNNTVSGFGRAVMVNNNAGATATVWNNALWNAATNAIWFTSGSSPVSAGNNCYVGTLGTYTKQATDVNETPSLDSNYVPTRGGNCDIGRGDPGARKLGELDSRGVPKLGIEDCIGAVYPTGGRPEDLLRAVVCYEVAQ